MIDLRQQRLLHLCAKQMAKIKIKQPLLHGAYCWLRTSEVNIYVQLMSCVCLFVHMRLLTNQLTLHGVLMYLHPYIPF